MHDTLDQLRAERLLREHTARRRAGFAIATLVVVAFGGILLFKGVAGAHGTVASASPNRAVAPPPAAPPSTPPPSAPAQDPGTGQSLQDATGLAASLLASTRSTEVARSALVAAQDMTGCSPKEGGPALVHLGDRAEVAAELAARADFYSTARANGREYATHGQAYIDRRTVVYVAVAWECGQEPDTERPGSLSVAGPSVVPSGMGPNV